MATFKQAQRSIADGPWSWHSKAALAKIAAACDSRTDKALVLVTYLALTWQASNKQAETFTVQKHALAGMAGIGYRKISDTLKFLCEIGVITSAPNFIEGSKAQGANTYTLCRVCTPSCTENTPPVHGSKQGSVPRLREESLEQSPRRNPHEQKDGAALPPVLDTDEFMAAWSAYLRHRRDKKLATMTSMTRKAQWEKLAEWGHAKAIQALNECIAGGWKCFYEPKANSSGLGGANKHQMPAATAADHAKGFLHGTGIAPREGGGI